MLLSRIHLIEHITRTLLPRTAIALPANRHLATSSTMSHASAQNQCISDPIKKDHRELEEYYHKILNAKDEDEKTRWANQFTWELARHSVGEELIMYPCMKRVLKNGESLVAKDLQQHQEVPLALFCTVDPYCDFVY